jgi:hypothetical protein
MRRFIYGLVYKITFSDGKIYIGQTANSLKTRINQHKNNFRDILSYEIIDTAYSPKDLNKKECLWIMKYKSYDPNIGRNKKIWVLQSDISEQDKRFPSYLINFHSKHERNIFNYDYKKISNEVFKKQVSNE